MKTAAQILARIERLLREIEASDDMALVPYRKALEKLVKWIKK